MSKSNKEKRKKASSIFTDHQSDIEDLEMGPLNNLTAECEHVLDPNGEILKHPTCLFDFKKCDPRKCPRYKVRSK